VKEEDPDGSGAVLYLLIPGCPTRLDDPDNPCTCDEHADNECVRQAALEAARWRKKYSHAQRRMALRLTLWIHRTYGPCTAHRAAPQPDTCPSCARYQVARDLRSVIEPITRDEENR
jgi:hypothetical protein